MLVCSLLASLLRVRVTPETVLVAATVAFITVAGASMSQRRVRRSGLLQIVAALVLALAGAPIEVTAGAAATTLLASASVKAIVFSSSVLVVRGALASSGKSGQARSAGLYLLAAALSWSGAAAFFRTQLTAEACVCLLTGAVTTTLAVSRPTAKDLKALGLCMSSLAFAATLVPLLP
jgi:hypothetical protein